MTASKTQSMFGLSAGDRAALLAGLKKQKRAAEPERSLADAVYRPDPKMTRFAEFPAYKQLRLEQSVAEKAGILNPFFQCHDGIAKAETFINGEKFLNFSTYDYLDLNGHPAIEAAAVDALKRWGTSASASRLVSGERPPHRALEKTIASLYDADDCIVYVSGHATNVSTIGKLFGPNDVIFHDALSHNSIVMGAMTSGAKRLSFPHNDAAALERLLKQHRPNAQRALIVTEGVFSMDGNIVDLPNLLRLKKQYGCFLMIDEAHALGVLGKTGRGTAEHFGISPREVDIWMGTLSKTCCGCGGACRAAEVHVAGLCLQRRHVAGAGGCVEEGYRAHAGGASARGKAAADQQGLRVLCQGARAGYRCGRRVCDRADHARQLAPRRQARCAALQAPRQCHAHHLSGGGGGRCASSVLPFCRA